MTNGDKIRTMSDEQLTELLGFIPHRVVRY